MKWTREGSGYDIQYSLYNPNGLLLAVVYRGGNKWYPWSWWLKDGSRRHGDSTSMRNAKESAEAAIFKSLT